MTTGAVYETALELTARGDFTSKIDTMFSKLDGLGDAATTVGSKLSDAFTGAVEAAAGLGVTLAKVGAAGAMGGLIYGVTSLNAGLEKTKVSLAAIFNANGVVNGMGEGMELGAEQMAKMRHDAAELPGEFSDLVGIFRSATIPGLRAGLSVDKIRELSANTMAAGAASGLQMDMVAREMGMLLSGHAGGHNVLGSQIFGLSGDKAAAFNKSSAEDRVKVLEKQLSKFGEAKSTFGKTWDGVTSTMTDNGKAVIGAATLPLFNAIKSSLGEVNTWFDANQDQISAYTNVIAGKLQDAFYSGKAVFLEYLPILRSFASEAWTRIVGAWNAVLPIVKSVGGHIDKMLRDPSGTLDKLTTVLTLYAGVKIGGPLAGGLLKGAGGLGGLAELGPAAGVAAVALAGIGVATYGVVDILTDSGNRYNAFAKAQVSDAQTHLDSIGNRLSGGSDGIGGALKGFSDAVGAASLWLGTGFLQSLDQTTAAIGWFTGAINSAGEAVDRFIGLLPKKPPPSMVDDSQTKANPDYDYDFGRLAGLFAHTTLGNADGARKNATKEAPQGRGTHIDKVEITVSGSDDPSRVARIVESHLSNLARNPRASRFTRNWSGAQ